MIDPNGTLSSLILIRLVRQWITWDNTKNGRLLLEGSNQWDDENNNNNNNPNLPWRKPFPSMELDSVIDTLASVQWSSSSHSLEAAIEGIKAASTLSRVVPSLSIDVWEPLIQQLHQQADQIVTDLEPHHLSGLAWSMAGFQFVHANKDQAKEKEEKEKRRNHNHQNPNGNDNRLWTLPSILQEAYNDLNLPFWIHPGFLLTETNIRNNLSVETLTGQVDFQRDAIVTSSDRVVQERRQTAWEGDDHVAAFAYSGKSMERRPWSPVVHMVRQSLWEKTGQYYDGCLINLYPNGESGMRYHIDPDQGTLWGYETAVVSIGSTRPFAFREIVPATGDDQRRRRRQRQRQAEMDGKSKPHTFYVLHGDVTEMFDDCQQRFQHTVKTGIDKSEVAPRCSLVFKKTLK